MGIYRYTTSFTDLLDRIVVTQLPAAADGQLMVGNGTGMALAGLTAGTGVSIANGPGTVTVNCTVTPADAEGAVQFNVGGAFAGDATRLVWNPTAHRLGLLTGDPHATLDNQGSRRVKRTAVTAAAYTVAATDFYVAVNYPTGLCTVTLPAANTGDGGAREVWVGDESGNVSGGGVDVVPAGTDTVNGTTSFHIGTARALAVFRADGSGGWHATLAGPALNSGTVTSVGLSMPAVFAVAGGPVTTSGTLTVTYNTQAANAVFAGPATGSPAAPTFRALVAADVPGLPASKITSGVLAAAQGGTGVDGSAAANGRLLIGNGAGFTLANLTAGTNISISNSAGGITVNNTGPTGTVTSVGLSMPSTFAVAGSPVTSSGTLTVSYNTQTANAVLAGPTTGVPAAPTFRALVAADVPALDASKVTTGQLAVARGGTGVDASAAANGTLLIGNGTGLTLATLTGGTNISISNSAGGITINSTAGTGSVTSVGLSMPATFSVSGSPVTTSGTLTVTYATQSANTVLAGPTTGAAAAPTFRALVAADVPSLDAAKITAGQLAAARGGTGVDASAAANGQLLVGNGTGFALATLTAGTGISVTNGAGSVTIANTGGTVTSVALSMPSTFSVSGSPVTTSGTLSVTYATQSANTVFAGPTTGAAAAPTFRALVAADVPSLDASKVTTGQLAAARGGTGLDGSAAANGQILIGNGSGFALHVVDADQGVLITSGAGTVKVGKTPLNTATDGATVTFDMSVSDKHTVTLGGNRTLAVSNDGTGLVFLVNLVQDGTGGRTVTWWSGIHWDNNTVPTLSTTANYTDTFVFLKRAANNYLGYVAGQGMT